MIYRDRFVEIRFVTTGDKPWCEVRTLRTDHTFRPSFEQLGAIIQQIVHAERMKYPNGGKRGRDPGWMVGEFCKRAAGGEPYDALRARFELPDKSALQTPAPVADPDMMRWNADLSQRVTGR